MKQQVQSTLIGKFSPYYMKGVNLDSKPEPARAEIARRERETRHPRYMAMIDAAIARATQQ